MEAASRDDLNKLHERMFMASWHGLELVVRRLADLGVDIRAFDDEYVRWASRGGHLATVRFLVSLGADVCAAGHECMLAAAFGGHATVVRYLVAAGAYARNAPPRSVAVSYQASAFGRAARRAYFAWVPRCYDRGRRVGRRMARRNLRDYQRLSSPR